MFVYTGSMVSGFMGTWFTRMLGLITCMFVLAMLRTGPVAADDFAPSIIAAPLSLDEVVDNLVRKNEERARNLLHSEGIRVYRLSYHGFPGDREAEMTVEACYDRPATKEFKIISQSGSKVILDRVFKKLLEGEQEAVQPQILSRSLLNRNNYDFAFLSYDLRDNQYVLQVTPKSKSKFVYRGKIWVDGNDFAVTRIEAEPAQNPSFWTRKSEVHYEYMKVQHSWLPARNQAISYVRLGGRATLTVEYKNYHLTEEHVDSASLSGAAHDVGGSR
jgi:hypothetical protein